LSITEISEILASLFLGICLTVFGDSQGLDSSNHIVVTSFLEFNDPLKIKNEDFKI
jgi:hypothetical protein